MSKDFGESRASNGTKPSLEPFLIASAYLTHIY